MADIQKLALFKNPPAPRDKKPSFVRYKELQKKWDIRQMQKIRPNMA